MSDLEEQSDIENISDDEISEDENKQTVLPTFPRVNTKSTNITESKQINDKLGLKLNDGRYSDDDESNGVESDIDDEESETDDEDGSMVQSDNEDDLSIDEESGVINKKKHSGGKRSSTQTEVLPTPKLSIPVEFEKNESDYESDNDEEEEDDYLQKFDREMRDNYILEQHPESISHNYDEIYNLTKVQRNKDNIIVDDLHKTIPILTKYEKTRILGQRAKQLNNGAKPLVKFAEHIIDGYLIALKELEEKKIPVIIRRPLPNGACEYWQLKDLEILM